MLKKGFKYNIHFLFTFLLICSSAFSVRAQSGETVGNIPFKINSLDYAYDKLIASFFKNDYSTTGILSKTVTNTGVYTIQTSRKQVVLGTGPGWNFYYVDRSRFIPIHHFFLITEDGRITHKALKNPPLDLELYSPVVSQRLRSKDIPALKTSDQAYNWLVHQQFGHTVGNRRIYVQPNQISNSISVDNKMEKFTLSGGPGWLFFVDNLPQANWGHPCLFLLVTESGQIVSRQATFPPINLSAYTELTEPIPEPPYRTPSITRLSPKTPSAKGLKATSANNRWAVIISGGWNADNNHVRYWNDCSYFYETLMDHGFLESNVYVLISDGTSAAIDQSNNTSSPLDLDGDGDDDTQYSATLANIVTVFSELETKLDGDDLLYIFTTDHGDSSVAAPYLTPESELCLWNTSIASDANFAAQVNRVTTLATICIFEQCFSGGMLDELMAENRVLMSAARFWELSYGGTGNAAGYDEYSYYFTHALANSSVADRNEDGAISMEEAHLYALANDSMQSETLFADPQDCPAIGCNSGEHPNYYSNPWDLGRKISLFGMSSGRAPPLMGSYIQQEVSETFITMGTGAQGWRADEESWEYDLPFSFPFYGSAYSTIWVESNGIIYFSDPNGTDNENTIDKLKSKRAIAPLWDDLHTTQAGDDIFIGWSSPWLTIRWKAHTVTDADDRPVNFAVKLNRNGNIRFLYGQGNEHTSRVAWRDKTIGLSKGDGSDYILCLRNGKGDLGYAESIEFIPYEFVFVDGAWGGTHLGTRANPFQFVKDGYDAIEDKGALFIRNGSYNSSTDVPITLSNVILILNYEGNVTIGD